MENQELIKRYVDGVVSHLPQKSQADVEKELESIVSDMLDARCTEREPAEADVRAVLTELGPPEELAVKYSGGEGKALLSGAYYLWFKRLLRIVLPIAASVIAVLSVIDVLTGATAPVAGDGLVSECISAGVSGGFEGAMQGFLWVLLVCFILERSHVRPGGPDFLSKLRPVPPRQARIKLHEPIVNICWNILAAVFFLGFPYLIGQYSEASGWMSAFDHAYIRSVWYLVALWTAISVGKEIYRLIERRYSLKLVAVTAGADLLAGACAGFFFLNPGISNPAFRNEFLFVLEDKTQATRFLAANVGAVLFAVIVFAMLLETATALYRALRYSR